jgi:hypothetical protein
VDEESRDCSQDAKGQGALNEDDGEEGRDDTSIAVLDINKGERMEEASNPTRGVL